MHSPALRGDGADDTWWWHYLCFCALNTACRTVEFKEQLSIDLTIFPQEPIHFHYRDQWQQCWVLWNSLLQVFGEAGTDFSANIYIDNGNFFAKPDSRMSNKYYIWGLITCCLPLSCCRQQEAQPRFLQLQIPQCGKGEISLAFFCVLGFEDLDFWGSFWCLFFLNWAATTQDKICKICSQSLWMYSWKT